MTGGEERLFSADVRIRLRGRSLDVRLAGHDEVGGLAGVAGPFAELDAAGHLNPRVLAKAREILPAEDRDIELDRVRPAALNAVARQGEDALALCVRSELSNDLDR